MTLSLERTSATTSAMAPPLETTSAGVKGFEQILKITPKVQDEQIQAIQITLPFAIRLCPTMARRIATSLQMAELAGKEILRVKESKENLQFLLKEDKTPVTIADHASNQILCTTILRLFRRDGILSEEDEGVEGSQAIKDAIARGVHAEWTWVLDPLDGTKAFLVSCGSKEYDVRYPGKYFGVHIGLLHKGVPVAGLNYYPMTKTFYFAANGVAYSQVDNAHPVALHQERICGIHPIVDPSAPGREKVRPIYEALMGEEGTKEFEKSGLFLDSCGHIMISIAKGSGNLFVAPPAAPGFWDVCSMTPLVEAMKEGFVTDWAGNPIDYRDMSQKGHLPKGVIICVGSDLHKRVVETIQKLIEDKKLPPLIQKEEEKKEGWKKV